MNDMNLDFMLLDPVAQHHITTSEIVEGQSNLRLFPPPIFARQTIPQGYKFVVRHVHQFDINISFHSFKANISSIESIAVDGETGEEKKRLINRMRWKGFGPVTVMFNDNYVCISASSPFSD